MLKFFCRYQKLSGVDENLLKVGHHQPPLVLWFKCCLDTYITDSWMQLWKKFIMIIVNRNAMNKERPKLTWYTVATKDTNLLNLMKRITLGHWQSEMKENNSYNRPQLIETHT